MTERPRSTVFVGISVDGFMARPDGRFDFLPENPDDHGFTAFMATVDALVMGRNTFEVVLPFDPWPYGKTRIVVLTTRPLDLSAPTARGAVVEQMSGTPEEIVARLGARGMRHLYVDGGDTIQRFMRAGLIDRLVITRVPVLIGEGISLFGAVPSDVPLRHVQTQTFAGGLVQSEYEVVR
jgi:dihydrofolate reductase